MRNYLFFSRSEKKGIFILITIITILIIVLILPYKSNTLEPSIAKNLDSLITLTNKHSTFKKKAPLLNTTKKVVIKKKHTNYVIKKESKKTFIIELNSCQDTDLIKLNGIGPVFSKRIIKFRNLLGGFIDKQQLLEVYGLSKETYNKISSFLNINKERIKPLNLNQSSFKALNKHPYISYKLTKIIVNKRRFDPFRKISELKLIPIVSDSLYKKIAPYVVCN